jgi:hypothetical protein
MYTDDIRNIDSKVGIFFNFLDDIIYIIHLFMILYINVIYNNYVFYSRPLSQDSRRGVAR